MIKGKISEGPVSNRKGAVCKVYFLQEFSGWAELIFRRTFENDKLVGPSNYQGLAWLSGFPEP
jgi:hypothetical protein